LPCKREGALILGLEKCSDKRLIIMRRSTIEIYIHVVWATKDRAPMLEGETTRAVYRCIQDQVSELAATVLAIGGMPDHVHVLVAVPATIAAATLAKQVKGVSSRFIKDQLLPGEGFGWQEGYGVFSVSRSHLSRVKLYI
jgi:putative transposase